MNNRLTVLAAEIQAADGHFRRSAVESATAALECGHKLIEAKSLVKHGQWRTWLQTNCNLSERSAQRYMQVARSGLQKRHVADLGIRAAAEAVSKKSSGEPQDMEALAEAVLVFLAMVVSYAGKSAAARRKLRLDVSDTFMKGADEWEKLASAWLKQTKAVEENIAVVGPVHFGMTREQVMTRARGLLAEVSPELVPWLPPEGWEPTVGYLGP